MTKQEQLKYAKQELLNEYYRLSPKDFDRLKCTIGIDSICANIIAKYEIQDASILFQLSSIEAKLINIFEKCESEIYNIFLEETNYNIPEDNK